MKFKFLKKFSTTDWHKSIEKDYKSYRFKLILFVFIFSIFAFSTLILYNTLTAKTTNNTIYFILIGVFSIFTVLLAITKAERYFIPAVLIPAFIGIIYLLFLPDSVSLNAMLLLAFPQLALALTGIRRGKIWLFFLITAIAVAFACSHAGILGLEKPQYSPLQVLGIIGTLVTVAALSIYSEYQHEKYLHYLTAKLCYDDITNLPNKELLIHDIEQNGHSILCLLQIDNFNDLGSIFGYDLSDHLLRTVSSHIKQLETQFKYSSYHLKSQEFAILIPVEKKIPEIDAQAILYSIWTTLQEQTIEWDNIEIRPIYRLGGVITKSTDSEALSKADIALKTGMRHKTPVTLFKNSDHEKQSAFRSIMKSTTLLENLKNSSFKVLYQPIVDTESHKVIWYESLVRIKNNTGEYESIYQYLPIAKSIGIYEEITKFVLLNATKMLKKIDEDVSVNISLIDITRPGFIDVIINCCSQIKDRPGKLILEIVETEELSELHNCLNFLNIARSVGCKIAIDDFGSGYSNMTNLIDLPVDIVKIDGGLIKKLPYDPQAVILVSNISSYCKNFDKKTVAEYVENTHIYDQIRNIGIDYSQGYMFGHPEELN